MKNKFKREKNIEVITMEYFKIAGVKSLEELKKTIYWKYYEREKKIASGQEVKSLKEWEEQEREKLKGVKKRDVEAGKKAIKEAREQLKLIVK